MKPLEIRPSTKKLKPVKIKPKKAVWTKADFYNIMSTNARVLSLLKSLNVQIWAAEKRKILILKKK